MNKTTLAQAFKIFSCICLIAGTCIGGGMLALPVSGGRTGFVPSVTVMLVAWGFMTMTGLLYVEICSWLRDDAHIISMADKILGKKAKILCWAVYLFIGYASLVAYLAEGGKIVSHNLTLWTSANFDRIDGSILYVLMFGSILALSAAALARLNSLLFCGMAFFFVLLVGVSTGHVESTMLLEARWDNAKIMSLFPLMLTTFSYPGLVPLVVASVDRKVKHARIAVVGGTTLTLITYLVWLAVVLGSVPFDGPFGLQEAYANDNSAAYCLQAIVRNPWISTFARLFGFLAITTSFLGVAWGLFHFLADGLGLRQVGWHRLLISGLVFVPTLLMTMYFERVFYTALEISGGVGDSLISGIVPAAMVWVGRYHKKFTKQEYGLKGKLGLLLIFAIGGFILIYEIVSRI